MASNRQLQRNNGYTKINDRTKLRALHNCVTSGEHNELMMLNAQKGAVA